jgi:SNF2 family DNA or RNA helicase
MAPILLATLLPYQLEAVQWCLHQESLGGVLAYDMGLGKTVIGCALMVEKPEKTLVMVPTGLLEQWNSELIKHTEGFTVAIHHGPGRRTKQAEQLLNRADIILSTPQVIARDMKNGYTFPCARWIVDEAHRLKNDKGKAYSYLYKNAHSVPYKLFFTGTPVCNNINDLKALLCLTNRQPYNSLKYWKHRSEDDKIKSIKELVPEFLLRRTKEDTVMDRLPSFTTKIIPIKLPAECEQRDIYNSFVDDEEILRRILRMRQSANSSSVFNHKQTEVDQMSAVKLEALEDLLATIPKTDKILVFSQFTSLLLSIYKTNKNPSHLIYHGGMNSMEKAKTLHKFKTDPTIQVLFINLRAGGCGLNLVEANHVILLEPYWNESEQKQAIDRVYRLGQKKPVTLYRFYLQYTIESWLQALQRKKQSLTHYLVDFEKHSEMTPEDLKQSYIVSDMFFQMCSQPALEEESTLLNREGEKSSLIKLLELHQLY